MNNLMIGIGDYNASKAKGVAIKTLALGSCVAVILLDPVTEAIGMAHIALPEASIDFEKSKSKPGYFADTAIIALYRRMGELGSLTKIQDMYIKIAGGANVLNNSMDIGNRNILAIKKILWQMGTGPVAEDVGHNYSRTVTAYTDTGLIEISSHSRGVWNL
ncbi:MAG: chemotaxis protein CheD [Candidatus Margulisiibacteriota bacterium]|nr:MAG: chemotaxis protein CheD [Candidatus Margulisbacteria bacterium GWD2_39_127]PZM79750.1 MAG: chemotaxis protein CheD [Candidatus Margulisiibacteriota bacterium]HAR62145.1 chemotaxis protein CheD [Candidatus Margulisiibacteriota bacterium]HCT85132.1 chemotaxis protein CheD [Candidatus Margulisiibacteriota bacterium]HCY36702.1 chemotaxis protein CheD [Candidatus Margulisiibacteriota bacterium]